MKLILVNQRYGHSRTIVIKGWLKGLLSLCLLGAPVALGYMGYHLALANHVVSEKSSEGWEQQLGDQAPALAELKQDAEKQVAALTQRLATLRARLQQLNALGLWLDGVAELDSAEFELGQQLPDGGGLLLSDGSEVEPPDFIRAITWLEQETGARGDQLETNVGEMTDQQFVQAANVAARPLNSGWLSSGLASRADLFTGGLAWRHGIDVSSSAGEDIASVAAGGGEFSRIRPGYGSMEEIGHGNGYQTRYAQDLLIEQGEVVILQGQAIAQVGSTGRPIGPHVHYEAYKHGRVVDPATYIRRTYR